MKLELIVQAGQRGVEPSGTRRRLNSVEDTGPGQEGCGA